MYNHNSTRQIIRLSIPVIVGQISHTVLNFTDRFFISRLGVIEAASVGLCVALMWFLFALSAVICGGTIALVSRKMGEQKPSEAAHSAEQSLLLSMVFGILVALICYGSSAFVFSLFGVEPQLERLGLQYFRILLIGYPFIMVIVTAASVFQATGDTKTPMKIFAFMSFANLVVDPFLIFSSFKMLGIEIHGFGLGIRGAGYATIMTEAYAACLMLMALYRFPRVKLARLWRIKPESGMIGRILRIGVWQGLNGLSRPLTAVILQKILAFHGTFAIAAFMFGVQWVSIIFLLFEGLRVAVATMVGQNLGRKDFQRAMDTVSSGLVIGNGLLLIFMGLGFPLADRAMGMFTQNPTLIGMGVDYLDIVLVGMIFSVPMTIFGAAFSGAGDTRPPMFVSLFANWVTKVGLAYLATYWLGLDVTSIWFAIAISIWVEGLGLWIWYRKGHWKTKVI